VIVRNNAECKDPHIHVIYGTVANRRWLAAKFSVLDRWRDNKFPVEKADGDPILMPQTLSQYLWPAPSPT
jgi:hypothetical protein